MATTNLALALVVIQGGSETPFSELACSVKEPSTQSEVPKAQPWKAHWFPNNKSASGTVGESYLADSTGNLIIDGFVGIIIQGGSETPFSELACSAKEPSTQSEVPKAQPWKAHWSPKENANDTAGEQYLASGTGNLIVDGLNDRSANGFTDLACSEKSPSTTTEAPKAQPWRAHWSPNENAARKADSQCGVSSAGVSIVDGVTSDEGRQYTASSSGSLIVDGDAGGSYIWSELACSKKEQGK